MLVLEEGELLEQMVCINPDPTMSIGNITGPQVIQSRDPVLANIAPCLYLAS